MCPRLVCDGEFSGAGVSGPVLACFVSDEGFVGLEWSAPNVSHEKSPSNNQVSVVLLHSSKFLRRMARRNSRVCEESVEGDRLASPRNWQLARAAPAQVPPSRAFEWRMSTISPNPRNLFSQLAVCVCLECIVVLVIMYSHRSPCSRSGAQVSHHNNVHRMIDVGHHEHVNFARLNEPRQGRHTGVQFLFW